MTISDVLGHTGWLLLVGFMWGAVGIAFIIGATSAHTPKR